jgi:S-adenosylmethionine synthetase
MRLFTSESVTPGHPDKLCDQVSDAILDAYLEQDPTARVAVEVMATARGLVIAGEVRSSADVDRQAVAKAAVRRVGYTRYALQPVLDFVVLQSAEIAAGVDESLELRHAGTGAYGPDGFDALDVQGAGDQGMMFGYAVDETPDLMPLPISLAHALARRLYNLAAEDDFAALGPDGKTQVTVRYEDDGRPTGVESVLVSTQHAERLRSAVLRRMMIRDVIKPVLEQHGFTAPASILVNPSGRFTVGGPEADAGLTGRKIIVDTYGGAARHGGGAFSGKDPSKVDRSAAYAMRWVAKHVVAAGLASRCEVQVAYAIGSAHPVGLYVETFGTSPHRTRDLVRAIGTVFDLRPAAIVRDLDLLRPIYAQTAAFGHFGGFGRPFSAGHAGDRPWEQLSPTKIAALQLLFDGRISADLTSPIR